MTICGPTPVSLARSSGAPRGAARSSKRSVVDLSLGLGSFRQRLGDGRLRLAQVDALRALAARDPVDRRAGDEIAIELNGAAGVVVRRNRVSDAVRIGIGVEDRDHRNLEAVGFLDRQRFLVGVDDEHEIGNAAHIPDAAERGLELVALARHHQAFFLGQALRALAELLIELAQARDRGRYRLPVGQHAAQPASVDEILRRTLGRGRDLVGRLALRADEQHASALGHGVGDRLQRLMEQWHRLGEVDDMDRVARAVDVGRHFRVPAMRLVAEMRARLEQLAHGEIWQSHGACPCPVEPRRIDRAKRTSPPERDLEQEPRKIRLWNGAPYRGREAETQAEAAASRGRLRPPSSRSRPGDHCRHTVICADQG